MKAATAAIAVLAMLAICLVPMQGVDADYADISGDSNVIGVGEKADFQIIYTNNDYNSTEYQDFSMSISYTAKLTDSSGETVSNGVSPSSGDLDNGVAKTISVSAPDKAGSCTLVVKYEAEVTYTTTDEDGEEVAEEETITRTEEFPIRVVEPITLSVTLTNNTNTDLNGYGIYFYVNDEKIEDSYTTVDLDEAGTTTVTYKWITDSGNGQYEFYVLPADGGNMVDIEGLGEKHTFYIGDNDYTWMIALLVIVIILLIIVMVWVYRKPVKNYGKPKSRR